MMIAVLTTCSATTSSSTTHNWRNNRLRSSSVPIVMKNSPSRTSRNGRMTVSSWWRYSVSASSMPARNAPRAIDRPTASVTQAAPSETSNAASVNRSVLRARPISWNNGRTSQRRIVSTSASAIAARRIGPKIDSGAQVLEASGQGGLERKQRHEGEILEQEDTDGDAAVRSVELRLFAELTHDDGRGGHRQRTADHDRDQRMHVERPQHGCERRRGQDHLPAAAEDRLAAHRDHPGQRELEPQGEHQEHHAELGHRRRHPVRGEIQGVRAEQHPDREITDDRRHAQAPERGDDQDREHEQQQQLRQGVQDQPVFTHDRKVRGLTAAAQLLAACFSSPARLLICVPHPKGSGACPRHWTVCYSKQNGPAMP